MPNALIDIIGVVPVQMVFAYALSRMLSIRNAKLYWALEISIVMLLAIFRSYMGVEFRLAASAPLALVPLVLSEGALSRRVLTVVLAHLVLFFAELPGGALWVTLTGMPVADYDAVRAHFDAFVITHAAHLVLLVPMLAVLCQFLNRFSGKGQGRAAWVPVAFTAVQLVLVNVMILLPLGYIEESMRYYALGVALSLLGLAADLLLFLVMKRVAQKRLADARAAMLEEQLDRYLSRYEEFVEDVENAAKMRHDAGNHLQVVLTMSERGRFREARKHLELVQRTFANADPSERRAS